MPHQLRIDTVITTLVIDFTDGLEQQIEMLLDRVDALPAHWGTTRYETDLAGLDWSAGGSRDQVIAILRGCRQHGWPFVAYVHARSKDEPARWSTDYATTYLGWWADRNAFAKEIATAGAHFVEDSVANLDPGMIDEICTGFVCLDVDGQVVVFDELPDHAE